MVNHRDRSDETGRRDKPKKGSGEHGVAAKQDVTMRRPHDRRAGRGAEGTTGMEESKCKC